MTRAEEHTSQPSKPSHELHRVFPSTDREVKISNMATAERARLEYLDSASSLLIISSPAVSSHLQSVKQCDTETTISRDKIIPCPACGNLMLPGWSCKQSATQKRTRRDRLAGKQTASQFTLECLKCFRITTIEAKRPVNASPSKTLDQPRTIQKAKPVSQSKELASSTATTMDSSTPSKIDAKRRGRGKKSSLQALLAERKTYTPAKAPGLSLEDFMK